MSLCLMDCIAAVQRKFTVVGDAAIGDEGIHNVDDKFAWEITQRVAEATGHTLKLGDLWVYVPLECKLQKGVAVAGYVTRDGELAIQAYEHRHRGHVGHNWYASPEMLKRLAEKTRG